MVQQNGEEYMTVEEVAVYLEKSRRTVERYVKDKHIQRYRRGVRFVFKRSDIEHLKNEPEEIKPEEQK